MSLGERPRGSARPTPNEHYNSLPRTSIEGALGRGRGVAAPALLHALIHPSAWNRYSANFAFWAFSEVRLSRIRDGRGVEASEIQVFDEDGLRPSRDGDILDNVGFVSFSDPDGNRWAVQQISFRG